MGSFLASLRMLVLWSMLVFPVLAFASVSILIRDEIHARKRGYRVPR